MVSFGTCCEDETGGSAVMLSRYDMLVPWKVYNSGKKSKLETVYFSVTKNDWAYVSKSV